MLSVCTWLWGQKFGAGDVAKLAAGVRRNLEQPHRFICFSEHKLRIDGVEFGGIIDLELTKIRGCFARLRMFDPFWQDGWMRDRLVCIDLDTVITGPLDPLFDRPEPFVIMQGGNSANPNPYNGALMMLRRGEHPEVWRSFSLKRARKSRFFEFPDDQGWIWTKIPRAAGWKCGIDSGVFVYHKPGWPGWDDRKNSTLNDDLPPGARLVTFSGWRSPKRFAHLDWVKQHWHVGPSESLPIHSEGVGAVQA